MSKSTHKLVINTRDGKLYAVEMRDGWIPARAIEMQPVDAGSDLASLDWSVALDATTWNASNLANVCEARRARMASGSAGIKNVAALQIEGSDGTPQVMKDKGVRIVGIDANMAGDERIDVTYATPGG